MNLREWISNSLKKKDKLQSEEKLKDKVLKALRIVRKLITDDIQISTKQINNMQPASTKREVLAAIKSTFDLLGWLIPAIIAMKIPCVQKKTIHVFKRLLYCKLFFDVM